jgi:hypothetical protein
MSITGFFAILRQSPSEPFDSIFGTRMLFAIGLDQTVYGTRMMRRTRFSTTCIEFLRERHW